MHSCDHMNSKDVSEIEQLKHPYSIVVWRWTDYCACADQYAETKCTLDAIEYFENHGHYMWKWPQNDARCKKLKENLKQDILMNLIAKVFLQCECSIQKIYTGMWMQNKSWTTWHHWNAQIWICSRWKDDMVRVTSLLFVLLKSFKCFVSCIFSEYCTFQFKYSFHYAKYFFGVTVTMVHTECGHSFACTVVTTCMVENSCGRGMLGGDSNGIISWCINSSVNRCWNELMVWGEGGATPWLSIEPTSVYFCDGYHQ